MKKALKIVMLSIFGTTLFSSCEGPMGPEGPMGNANVTIWKTSINSSGWNTAGETQSYELNCPIITSEVINGSFHVTASLEINNSFWATAPYIEAGSDYTETCQFWYGEGSPNSILYAYSDDDITTIHYSITQIKVAVIEGMSGKKEWTIGEIEANPHLFNITYIED